MHEAEFVTQLVLYLLKNGYQEGSITVLTFYLGQNKKLRETIRQTISAPFSPKLIDVQTVDNYQGQENDIIILSCVRSNTEKKGGFSVIQNRINVALSRARNGLFVIGNITMLAQAKNYMATNKNIWTDIRKLAKEENTLMYGTREGIELACNRQGIEKFLTDCFISLLQAI